MNEILSLDFQNISFGALFVWLLWDTQKKNETRETKYQETISDLANTIGKDVTEIKNILIGGVENE